MFFVINRIYIKKVKKFPEFAVDINQDKKMLRFAMDRAFAMLREKGVEHGGQERSDQVLYVLRVFVMHTSENNTVVWLLFACHLVFLPHKSYIL